MNITKFKGLDEKQLKKVLGASNNSQTQAGVDRDCTSELACGGGTTDSDSIGAE